MSNVTVTTRPNVVEVSPSSSSTVVTTTAQNVTVSPNTQAITVVNPESSSSASSVSQNVSTSSTAQNVSVAARGPVGPPGTGSEDAGAVENITIDGDDLLVEYNDPDRPDLRFAGSGGESTVVPDRCITDPTALTDNETRFDASNRQYNEYAGFLVESNGAKVNPAGPVIIQGIGLALNKGSLNLSEHPRGLEIGV